MGDYLRPDVRCQENFEGNLSRGVRCSLSRMAKAKKPTLPPEALEFFREQGRIGGSLGGSLGGKRSLETMTPEERSARAKKAVAAREAKRKALSKGSRPKSKKP